MIPNHVLERLFELVYDIPEGINSKEFQELCMEYKEELYNENTNKQINEYRARFLKEKENDKESGI